MFRDNSLVPTEAVRLAALGFLTEAPYRYGDLAGEIRRFTSRIVGPSLEMMGTSIELLRYDGLVEAVDGKGMEDNALLRLTEAGRTAFSALMGAALKVPGGEINRLAVALKLRFLYLLPEADRMAQIALLTEWCQAELARLVDLRESVAVPALLEWLDLDIAQYRARIDWLSKAAG
jgi:DNA-binding PadR family transcriptional regulator